MHWLVGARLRSPFHAARTEFCNALPKLKVKAHGFGPGVVLMVFRLIVAWSSVSPPDRKTTPKRDGRRINYIATEWN